VKIATKPFWVQTRTTPMLAVPYPIELNDQPTIVNRCATAAQYAEMLVDQFDEMQRRAVTETLVYAISIHTFIMGQPFRLTHLRQALTHILAHRETLWVTLPGAIAWHYRTLPPDQQLTGA
jgi:allantoinase